MSAPSRHRDAYLIGVSGSYEVPTVAACDKALRIILARLEQAPTAAKVARMRADVDAILDRRTALAFEEATRVALDLTREP